MKDIIILGNARCYHTMDWYRIIKSVCNKSNVLFATDLISSEGHKLIINKGDKIVHLFNVDRFLFSSQSKIGNIWRNIVKLLAAPFQVSAVKRLKKEYPNSIVHAHTMYYMFLCWFAKVEFIGTPQGSEVLVRPKRSKVYKYFATKALSAAKHVTVDSVNMADRVNEISGKKCFILQNGIDTQTISRVIDTKKVRDKVISIRGMSPLYRIDEIMLARSRSQHQPDIDFIYPLWEDDYKITIEKSSYIKDRFLGRIERDKMYQLFNETLLAISIPYSDSSPRSVYEAIFCGCIVAVTYNPWLEVLPDCMKKRVVIVDLTDVSWLDNAIDYAISMVGKNYIPSRGALELFDQIKSVETLSKKLYYNNHKL